MKVDKSNIGKLATITNVLFENHREMLGKRGIIKKAVKSRNVYTITLTDGRLCDKFPENISIPEEIQP